MRPFSQHSHKFSFITECCKEDLQKDYEFHKVSKWATVHALWSFRGECEKGPFKRGRHELYYFLFYLWCFFFVLISHFWLILLIRKEVRAAFVSFKSRYGAAVAVHMLQANNPTQWLTEPAPEPQDVYWPFFSSTFMGRWISRLVVIVGCMLLTIVFLIPVFIVQGLTNLAQLETYFPFLQGILTM